MGQDLFAKLDKSGYTPLADRMRPATIDEVVGQEHLVGPDKPLRIAIETNQLPSIILWGPPGSGKTTLAYVIAHSIDAHYHFFSAVLSGVKELRAIIDTAKQQRRMTGKKTILFVDEIHRFNKAQQDAFLPHIEQGTVILIGATTENPSFEVIAPLLSRTKVYVLEALTAEHIETLINRALKDKERGLGSKKLKIADDALKFIANTSDGDARRAYNTLEIAAALLETKREKTIKLATVEGALQKKSILYDKLGEEHYNVISAFIKSMRGSNPDAALYWMARMLEAGEDPLFIARRMVIFASEDVGNADPQAIQVAIATMQSFDFVGMPEGWIPLAQCATYLASAPKSNKSYMAYKFAKAAVEEHGVLPVPKHLRNAPTKLMENLGYSDGYKYPHDFEGHFTPQQYLPDRLKDKTFYDPSENGYERHIAERLRRWRSEYKK